MPSNRIMSQGLDKLRHIVVLMMENRSFDHMLGGLQRKNPKINGLIGNESNPDANGNPVTVSPDATFQGQFAHDPDHHFAGVDLQIFGGQPPTAGREPNMQGFIKSYATQGAGGADANAVMHYFPTEGDTRLTVLQTLATEYAVFNGWFSSIPGPTICNRAFAHYGTSFGNVDMNMFLFPAVKKNKIPSIYERLRDGGHAGRLYYFDQPSSTMEIVNLLTDQSLFGTFDQFVRDCKNGTLPEYSFVEPNYTDHAGPGGGQLLANDQHPDHHVLAGDRFIAAVYNQIRIIPELWQTTALLIVYDEHGGIYDHVKPPRCDPTARDGYTAPAAATGTGVVFDFDRLGVRVPAILVSPYNARGTVVPRPEHTAVGRTFEHASIPATVSRHFLKEDTGTPREQAAETFLDLLGDTMRPDNDCVFFNLR
jgi:phospholipase C